MSTTQNQELSNDLMSAFLDTTVTEPIIVKAEDVPLGTGMNFSDIFFEPQVGKTYRVKFVQNPHGQNLSIRKVYKSLPDPTRRGKSFHHVSSGVAATDPALELFFELHKLKKDGDALAEKKIKDYMSSTNQACSIVQIVTSDDEDIKAGEYRLWVFSNFGPNATIANLIDSKVNPSAAEIEDGAVAENIWNIFNSSIMLVQVGESEYDGQKGRDFTKSKWTEKKTGVSVKMDDNSTYTFSEEDNEGGKMRAEAIPAFKKLIEILNRPNLSVHNYFSYKVIDDPKNTPETNEYLKKVDEKLATIIPIIKNAKSIEEIQQACTVDTTTSNDSNAAKNTGTNILAESLPEELQGSVIDTNTSKPTTDSSNSEAASILDGI